MELIGTIALAVWAMLPAYVPNNVAVVAGGGRPIDAGHTLAGRRVLGDGKTWRGTVAGVTVGAAVAVLLNAARPSVEAAIGPFLTSFPAGAILGLPLGALLGDIGASFLKRRTGRNRGAPFPGVDQLDFVVGALVVTAALATDWFRETFTPPVLLVVVVLTPVLHVGTNLIAYRLGLKDEPW